MVVRGVHQVNDPFVLLMVWGAAALGFFLMIDGFVHFVSNTGGKGASRIERRLAQETKTKAKKLSESVFAQHIEDPTIIHQIESYIDRSGVKLTLLGLMACIGGLTVITFGIYTVILPFASPILVASAALISGMAFPFMYLRRGVNKRILKFQEQFPDAVDLMARSLRIGHPISAALENIAEEMADPVGHEFRIVTQAIAYGKNVPDAIEDMLKRVDISDVRFFVVAIRIHHQSGGDLGEILAGLSNVIRGRFHLFRKVKALTVEGRFSAWFLSAFPVVMIFGMNLLQPGYYEKVSDVEYFDIAVAVTFAMLLLNVVAMRMMTKLEV